MDLAAFLAHLGHEVTASWWTMKGGRWTCMWTFEDTPDLREDMSEFMTGRERLLDPRAFAGDLTAFKKEAYSRHPEPPRR